MPMEKLDRAEDERKEGGISEKSVWVTVPGTRRPQNTGRASEGLFLSNEN